MRLIDANALIEQIKNPYTEYPVMIKIRKAIEDMINEAPTVDAEPVVRCKDCTYYVISRLKRDGTEDKRYTPSVCVRGAYAKPRKADWYCADGERREDGDND